jgi:hypothetical protein
VIPLNRNNCSNDSLQADYAGAPNRIHFTEPTPTSKFDAPSINVVTQHSSNRSVVVCVIDVHMGVNVDVVGNLVT